MQCDDSTNVQEKKPKGVHVSGQKTAEKIQTVICLVPFEFQLHLVTAARHSMHGKYTWQRSVAVHSEHGIPMV